jgi:hypothetical protein
MTAGRAGGRGGPPPQVFPLAPLYPTLLGLLYRVTDLGADAMFTVQHAFGVGLVLAVAIAAALAAGRREWTPGRRPGW